MTDVTTAVATHFKRAGYMVWIELRNSRGYASRLRVADIFALHPWPSKFGGCIGVEVKESRADFLSELRKPEKRRFFNTICNLMYFATPKGMVKIEEVPLPCGLIEVDEAGKVSFPLEPVALQAAMPTWRFIASLCSAKQFEAPPPGYGERTYVDQA